MGTNYLHLLEPLEKRLEAVTSYAALSQEQRNAYDADLQVYRDLVNQLDYAKDEGRAEGRAEGLAEGEAKGEAKAHKATILRLQSNGVGMDMMKMATGLTQREIEAIIGSKA